MTRDRIGRPPRPTDNYSILDNRWARDPGLSLKEKGFLWYLSTHSADYDLSTEQIVRETEDGKDGVQATINRLIAKGWLEREEMREGGRFAGFVYTLREPDYMLERTATGKSRRGADQEKQASTATGKARRGASPQRDLTAAANTAAGKSASKKNNVLKKTTEENTAPPAPAPVTARHGAAIEQETGGIVSAELMDELAVTRPDWLASDIVAAMSHPEVAERDVRQPGLAATALRLLAEDGRYGDPTWKPQRLRHGGAWWRDALAAMAPPKPATPPPGPRCSCTSGKVWVDTDHALWCPHCRPQQHRAQLARAQVADFAALSRFVQRERASAS